jgi:hypothetical protein
MKMRGFALLDLIITIILMAVMAAMVIPFFKPGVTRGTDPFSFMSTPLSVQTILANIIADYSSNVTYLHDLAQFNTRLVNGNYGLSASVTITKDPAYKFNQADMDTSLKLTIRDNASGQTVTYIFTKQL